MRISRRFISIMQLFLKIASIPIFQRVYLLFTSIHPSPISILISSQFFDDFCPFCRFFLAIFEVWTFPEGQTQIPFHVLSSRRNPDSMNVFRGQFFQKILILTMQTIHQSPNPTTLQNHYDPNAPPLHWANLHRKFYPSICFYFSQSVPNHPIPLSFSFVSAACSYEYNKQVQINRSNKYKQQQWHSIFGDQSIIGIYASQGIAAIRGDYFSVMPD